MGVKKSRRSVAAKRFWTLFDKDVGGYPFDKISEIAQGYVGKWLVNCECYSNRPPKMEAVVVASVETIDLRGKDYSASDNGQNQPTVILRCKPENTAGLHPVVLRWGESIDAAHLYESEGDAMKDVKNNEGVVMAAFCGTVHWLRHNIRCVRDELRKLAKWEEFFDRHGCEVPMKPEAREDVERIRRAVEVYESEADDGE